jgi:demethylmacrocin O-methyltransferase
MRTLIEILKKTPNLDGWEGIPGTDKNTRHNYIDGFYEKEFKKYQEKENISILEIGIANGASLYLWAKYFKNAKITGIDIEDRIVEQWKLDNIKYIFEDGYKETFVKNIGFYDIIIDDGPHTLESQLFSLKYYLPKVNKGGIFIIEDVAGHEALNILYEKTPEEFKNKSRFVDLTASMNRFDNMLYIIRL